MDKAYLGDSVYVQQIDTNGFKQLILTTENGYGPDNTIVLDDEVFPALINFAKQRGWANE